MGLLVNWIGLFVAEERISELQNVSIETLKTKNQRE